MTPAHSVPDRSSSKNTKYKDYYSSLGAVFVPLVVSTFGVMHDDFVRLLWILARPARDDSLAVGEVREAGRDAPRRQLIFHKLRARIAVAAAYAAAMRLDGTPLEPAYLSSVANYVPDDPAFALDVALDNGLCGGPIGPVRGVAENG